MLGLIVKFIAKEMSKTLLLLLFHPHRYIPKSPEKPLGERPCTSFKFATAPAPSLEPASIQLCGSSCG